MYNKYNHKPHITSGAKNKRKKKPKIFFPRFSLQLIHSLKGHKKKKKPNPYLYKREPPKKKKTRY
jgi:hypothetical protein